MYYTVDQPPGTLWLCVLLSLQLCVGFVNTCENYLIFLISQALLPFDSVNPWRLYYQSYFCEPLWTKNFFYPLFEYTLVGGELLISFECILGGSLALRRIIVDLVWNLQTPMLYICYWTKNDFAQRDQPRKPHNTWEALSCETLSVQAGSYCGMCHLGQS